MEPIYSNYSPTFLYVEKYRFPEAWVSQSAKVPFSMLRYICSGSARFAANGEESIVQPGDVYYIPQGSNLYCAAREEIVFISIRFIDSIQILDEDMLKRLWNIKRQYSFVDQPQMREWFERVWESAISRSTYKRLETRGYLNLICAALAKRSDITEEKVETVHEERAMMESMDDMKYIRKRALASQPKTDLRIQALVDYITLHPEVNMNCEEMCQMCEVSESTLRRLFKRYMGKTVFEFIRDNKVQYAAHLLVTTNIPISEIGYKVGYESPSFFTKTFRIVFGVSPQKYRKDSMES